MKRMKPQVRLMAFPLLLILLVLATVPAAAQGGAVRAVLFFLPTCPHCHVVMEETLPPLLAEHGDRLQIATIDVSTAEGQTLYGAAVERFAIPPSRIGVPTLIVGGSVLVGSLEIPEQFPALVNHHLLEGGVDWPDIPGLSALTSQFEQPPQDSSEASDNGLAEDGQPTAFVPDNRSPFQVVVQRFTLDPRGNSLSVVLLAFMVATLFLLPYRLARAGEAIGPAPSGFGTPLLCLVGVGIASYLAFIETTGARAVCGPVGDCNAVQSSPYAMLFGVIPLGLLGAAGYVVLLGVWAIARLGKGVASDAGQFAILFLSLGGVLFSIYLTFLEPFVIGATCIWCLGSAAIMTAVLWREFDAGWRAWQRLRRRASMG